MDPFPLANDTSFWANPMQITEIPKPGTSDYTGTNY
jgi:hypothetical protein